MALSMTGCGEGVVTEGGSTCRVEVRGVNNKHFKMVLRTRDGVSSLEPRIEEAVRRRVRRGTVQVTVDLAGAASPPARRLDKAQLAAYLDDLADFCATHDLPLPRDADGLLSLPGIIVEAHADDGVTSAATWPLLSRALECALDGFVQMRRDEGESLAAAMRATCDELRGHAERIRQRVPDVTASARARLLDRVGKVLAELGTTLGEGDVAREVALLAERSDIDEELVRLVSHVDQFVRLLGDESPGRQLDFLAQELGREANTIASKSADVSIAHTVVELKTCIERLREQAQNLE